MHPSDETLVNMSLSGDHAAFAQLIRRYETALAGLVRRYVPNPDHADDVLQTTLIQAWTGLANLNAPEKFGAWLLRITRHRCLDFLKTDRRYEKTTDSDELDSLAAKQHHSHERLHGRFATVVEALDTAPQKQKQVARMFYLEGFTVAEIAERQKCARGTVKKRLFHARNHIRKSLGVPTQQPEDNIMIHHKFNAKSQPFPARRPDMQITASEEQSFETHLVELANWFLELKPESRSFWAMYDDPDGKLTVVHDTWVEGPAKVHDLDGFEVRTEEWKPDSGWHPFLQTRYLRHTADTEEMLACLTTRDDGKTLSTYMDKEFVEWWGEPEPRLAADRGKFTVQSDGSFVTAGDIPAGEEGCGMFDVTVGGQTHTCLRLLRTYQKDGEQGVLMESFIDRDGRCVMCRRYNGRLWNYGGETPWDERLPDSEKLVIDGNVYVHWYDCIPGRVLGVDEKA